MLVHRTLLQSYSYILVISSGLSIILQTVSQIFHKHVLAQKDDTKVFGLRNWKTVVVIYQFGEERNRLVCSVGRTGNQKVIKWRC